MTSENLNICFILRLAQLDLGLWSHTMAELSLLSKRSGNSGLGEHSSLSYHQLSGWCWNNPLSLVLISSNSSPDHLVENCLKLSDTVVWVAYYEAQMCMCSVVSDSCNPRTVAPQTPLSMGFSRQEYRSGTPFPSPGDLPNPGIEPKSSWQEDSLPLSHRGSPWTTNMDRRFKITWLIQNEMI